MAQGRFWEATTPPDLGNQTSISYYDNKLYVLESTDAIDSVFMVYDVNAGSWRILPNQSENTKTRN